MVYTQTRIHSKKMRLKIQTDHQILIRRLDLVLIKKRTYHLVDFAVPVDHSVKMKVKMNRDKYLDLARKLKRNSSQRLGKKTEGNGWLVGLLGFMAYQPL